MTCGTAKIDKTTLSEEENSMTIREGIPINLRLDICVYYSRVGFKSVYVNLVIKVPNVAYDR